MIILRPCGAWATGSVTHKGSKMKLRTRIQQSMILVIVITLVAAYAITTAVVYRQTVDLVEDEIRQEAHYLVASVELYGSSYLWALDKVQENTRITLIDEDGNVLYESTQEGADMENHLDRPEVQEALENGKGTDIRDSDTLGESMYYYAYRLSDGTVLRVSKAMDTVMDTGLRILPVMSLIGVVMLLLAYVLSRWQVGRLTRPINNLDVEHPLDNDTYEELSPLLHRMDEENQEREAVANMRQEFTANVSHELKTPLTSISGYAEIMRDGLVKPEDMNAFADRIYQEARRLVFLVDDIMELSRLDEGAEDLEKEEVDLYALAGEIVERLKPAAEERSVSISLTGEPTFYAGVRQVLDEMIYNLCDNAIKYNQEGGTVTVRVFSDEEGQKVSVQDTGIGIPAGMQDRIFERFYRVDKSHSKETGGTGLGLSIVKHGAMIHDAEIQVDSEVGKGTKMTLVFKNENGDGKA